MMTNRPIKKPAEVIQLQQEHSLRGLPPHPIVGPPALAIGSPCILNDGMFVMCYWLFFKVFQFSN